MNFPFTILKAKDLPQVQIGDKIDFDSIIVVVKGKEECELSFKKISKDEIFRQLGRYAFGCKALR